MMAKNTDQESVKSLNLSILAVIATAAFVFPDCCFCPAILYHEILSAAFASYLLLPQKAI